MGPTQDEHVCTSPVGWHRDVRLQNTHSNNNTVHVSPAMPSTLVVILYTNLSFSQPFSWVFTDADLSSITRSHQLDERFQTFMTESVRICYMVFLICLHFLFFFYFLASNFSLPIVSPSNLLPTEVFPALAKPPAEWNWKMVLSCFPITFSLSSSSYQTVCACLIWTNDVSRIPYFLGHESHLALPRVSFPFP